MTAWPTIPDPELPSVPEGPYELMIPYSRLLAMQESEHEKSKITNFSIRQSFIAIGLILITVFGIVFCLTHNLSALLIIFFFSLFVYLFFYAYFTSVAVYGAPSHMQIGCE